MAIAQLYLQILNIDDTEKLVTLDPDKFFAVHSMLQRYFPADKNCAWRPVGPVVDGTFAPQLPAQFLSEQTYPRRDFEVMIGFAKDEWQYFRGHSKTAQHGTEDDAIAIFEQVFGKEGAKRVYETYRELYPDHAEPGYTLGDVVSFEFLKYASLAIARNFASHGIPTHLFQPGIVPPRGRTPHRGGHGAGSLRGSFRSRVRRGKSAHACSSNSCFAWLGLGFARSQLHAEHPHAAKELSSSQIICLAMAEHSPTG